MAARLAYYQIAGAAAWVPMALFGMEAYLNTGRKRYLAFLSLGVGFSLLSGFVQLSVEALYLIAAFVLARLPGLTRERGPARAMKQVLLTALACGAGILISAPQTLPSAFFALSGASTRVLLDSIDPIRMRALDPGALASFFLPSVLGHPYLPEYAVSPMNPCRTLLGEACFGNESQSNFFEVTTYMGILVPCLILGMVGVLRERKALFFLIVAVLGVLAACDTPVMSMSFHLPGLDIGDPKRFLFITALALSCVAALAFDRFQRNLEKRRFFSGPAIAAAVLAAAAFTLAAWAGGSTVLREYIVDALAGDHNVQAGRVTGFIGENSLQDATAHIASCLLTMGVSCLAACLVLLVTGLQKTPPGMRTALPVLFVITEMCLFCHGINRGQVMEGFNRPTPLAQRLCELDDAEGPFRIARFRDADVGPEAVFPTKLPMLSGIDDVQGYVAIYMKRYKELIDTIEPDLTQAVGIRSFKKLSSLESPLLDLLGARYLLTREVPDNLPEKIRVADTVDGVVLLENMCALPRAFVVQKVLCVKDKDASLAALKDPDFDPCDEVIVEGELDPPALNMDHTMPSETKVFRESPSTLTIEVSSGGGILVLTGNNHTGWSAEVDGKAAPLFYADHAFCGVPLSPGKHTVIFRYESTPVFAGLSVGLAGILLTLFFLLNKKSSQ